MFSVTNVPNGWMVYSTKAEIISWEQQFYWCVIEATDRRPKPGAGWEMSHASLIVWLLCICSFQLWLQPRTSRSDLTRCTFTPTRRQPSAMTVGRCYGGSSDRASSVKVRTWCQCASRCWGFIATRLFEVTSCYDDSVLLWLTPALTCILNELTEERHI